MIAMDRTARRILIDWPGRAMTIVMPFLVVLMFLYLVFAPMRIPWYFRASYAGALFLLGGIYLPRLEKWMDRKGEERIVRRRVRE